MKFDFLLNNKKHDFKIITKEKFKEGKEKLERNIPDELIEFYTEVGCGFVCFNNEIDMINRILSPLEILDFYNREDIYEFDEDRVDEYIELEDQLVFMELSEWSFLTVGICEKNGGCPVFYDGDKIADSLLEFLIKMEEKDNYYI